VDLILGLGQQGGEVVIEQLVVFDQQYFHKVRDHGDPSRQLEGLCRGESIRILAGVPVSGLNQGILYSLVNH
jgi:hypothetical protein